MRALLAAVAVAVSMGLPSAGTVWADGTHGFGVEKFASTIVNENGEPATQAGSHPYAMTTTIEFATHVPAEGSIEAESELNPAPNGLAKEVEMNFPTGVIVNPTITRSKCAEAELDTTFECPAASVVGIADIKLAFDEGLPSGDVPVYDMVSPYGVPAEFGFVIKGVGVVIHVVGSTRTGGDYGLSAMTPGILERGYLYSVALTLWGDPTAESHDGERGLCAELGGSCPVERTDAPLLTLPSACTGEPLVASMSADSWEEPARFVTASAELPAVTGCKALGFAPTLSVQPVEPTVVAAESPTALEIDLKIPREESLKGLAESDLKEAEVKLPTGMVVSPSGVNGLEACPLLWGRGPWKEEAEGRGELVGINFESKQPANCPAAAKLGSVQLITPLLEQPLKGSIYFAQQRNLPGYGSHPFGSLFALYVVAEGGGAIVKFAGDVVLDRSTGQVSVRFGGDPTTGLYLPELPFSELKMRFFGGPRAPLAAPPECGTYTTTSLLTPYGSEAKPLLEPANPTVSPASSSFTVSEGCGPRGFSPTLTAGTTNPQAGGFGDETVTIARHDREQDLRGVTVTTPPGLLALLGKVPLCQEPQAGQGACGEASEIGETAMAIGPGEDPYWITGGRVYLTGPYDREPFGLAIVVPTVAGPLTLTGEHGGPGREVVRASIAVSSKTGALTISTDPLPSTLEGVPLDIRTIEMDINRSEFTLNPTNCEELHVTSAITSADGATAIPSSRFQAANCAALAFKPSLSARTQGDASNIGNGASLNVKVSQRAGEAAIRSIYLELPKKLPARLHTLQQACRPATFEVNPANCPAASDVGRAIVHTPVLPVALEGPGYFVSHGAQYPELTFVLQGDGVTIDLAGQTHIDTKTKITSVGFGAVPDAPISSFEANLPEGVDSALAGVTPKGVCGSKSLSMPTTIVGQNGARVKRRTKVAIVDCPKKGVRKPGKRRRMSRRR